MVSVGAVHPELEPPGPKPGSIAALRALLELRVDPLRAFGRYLERYGPVVRFPFGARAFYLLSAREHFTHVLRDNAKNYDKETHSYSVIRDVLGRGVLTSNGERWRRQRRLVQPALSSAPTAGLVGRTTEYAREMLEGWERHAGKGERIELQSEMVRLTLTIVARVLFGYDARPEAEAVSRALSEVLSELASRAERILPFSTTWPLPRNRRFDAARARLEREAEAIVSSRADARTACKADLLGPLLSDPEASEREVCHQILTVYVAGHETTATTLVWTLCLLLEHPDYLAEVRAELARVIGARDPTEAELEKLPKLRAALEETLRLYPPIWLLERRAIADDRIGGYGIRRGSVLALPIYSLQRNPAYMKEPGRFDPTRHLLGEGNPGLPFSMGPRMCAGAEFAWTEMMTALAVVLPHFDLELERRMPAPSPGVTLRPSRPIFARLRRRRAGARHPR